MVVFVFTKKAEKKFFYLQAEVRQRIIQKLQQLKKHQNVLSLLKTLHSFEPATHRLRIGDFRLILELKKKRGTDGFEFWILDIGHRRDIYQ